MQVRVKTLTGKEVEIDIEPKDKVRFIAPHHLEMFASNMFACV
jgi:hypothetical protein